MTDTRLAELLETTEIIQVINASFQAIDERNFDVEHLGATFMPDGVITRPNGTTMTGPQEISDSYQQSFARFESTQHLLTGHTVDIQGETATARVNLVAMHLWQGSNKDVNDPEHFFIAGALITLQLARHENAWKIQSLTNTNVWRGGAGFANMANTDKN